MTYIKGDIVELVIDEKSRDESSNWAQKSNIPLNIPLIIERDNGEQDDKQWIKLVGYGYQHPARKFILINKDIIYEIF